MESRIFLIVKRHRLILALVVIRPLSQMTATKLHTRLDRLHKVRLYKRPVDIQLCRALKHNQRLNRYYREYIP